MMWYRNHGFASLEQSSRFCHGFGCFKKDRKQDKLSWYMSFSSPLFKIHISWWMRHSRVHELWVFFNHPSYQQVYQVFMFMCHITRFLFGSHSCKYHPEQASQTPEWNKAYRFSTWRFEFLRRCGSMNNEDWDERGWGATCFVAKKRCSLSGCLCRGVDGVS